MPGQSPAARRGPARRCCLSIPTSPITASASSTRPHLRSGEGWNFTGASFFGTPLPVLGHNEHCGWGLTTNEPNVGSSWRETFDDPDRAAQLSLRRRLSQGRRMEGHDQGQARQSLRERSSARFARRTTARSCRNSTTQEYVSAQVAKLYDAVLSRQSMRMIRAKNFAEFREAMGMLELPLFNTVYAECTATSIISTTASSRGAIPSFDWTKPVDGSDPAHRVAGHPHDRRAAAGPAIPRRATCRIAIRPLIPRPTTPARRSAIIPDYMVEDRYDDKRRAKMSRLLLRKRTT